MSKNPQERQADGITLNKLLITLLVAIIGYVYTADRSVVKDIALDVRQIREQGIITYSHVENNSAAILKNSEDDLRFREEQRIYWSKNVGL